MFEVGKTYTIKMWEDDDNSGIITEYDRCRVLEVQNALVKIRQSGEEVIINTASMAFINAVADQEDD
jgi:hypothetical protein